MEKKMLQILKCPQCLGNLELKEEETNNNIQNGKLHCKHCDLNFLIKDGVPIFGLKLSKKNIRLNEITGENEWVHIANDISKHIDFAKDSSKNGEKIIEKLEQIIESKSDKKLRVLDLGSGWGCFQSWQFKNHGYEVIAVDLCPEFIMSSDFVVNDLFFERIISDCTVLPFENESFDIIFCKELIHHVDDPIEILNEMFRICSQNGKIIIEEPCTSILLTQQMTKIDEAIKVGITHYYYTYKNYVDYMKLISKNLYIDEKPSIISNNHKILSIIQKSILYLSKIPYLEKIIFKLHLIFIGGSITIIGTKNEKYKLKNSKREIYSISIENINDKEVNYYRNTLIPLVFKIFKNSN